MTRSILAALVLTAAASAQTPLLPDGAGKAETLKICGSCHELERSFSLRQDRAGWRSTVDKMAAFGLKADEKDLTAVVDYLARHFPPGDEIPRINVNEATAIQLESGLSLRRSQAAAILQYREKNGKFKSLDDLKKVPGIDVEKIEAKKDRLAF